jgi:hypothetical protein
VTTDGRIVLVLWLRLRRALLFVLLRLLRRVSAA